MCGDFELNDDAWPASDTGSSVTWNSIQTARIVPVYWFTGYQVAGSGNTTTLDSDPEPEPGWRVRRRYGSGRSRSDLRLRLDRLREPGSLVCPPATAMGACCNPATGGCTETTQANVHRATGSEPARSAPRIPARHRF